MLSDISTISTTRLEEVRSFLSLIRNLEASSGLMSSSVEVTVAKGLFFVHLYGAYECTVNQSIQKTLQIINSQHIPVVDYKPVLLGIVLNAPFQAVCGVGADKKWNKRREFFQQLISKDPISFSETILPTGTGNLKSPQLETIWATMGISDPVLPKPSLIGLLEELVDNRNKIAHGRESPVTIGSRFTIDDLEKRFNDINKLCDYIIQCLETYLSNKDFLR